jgi:hypothetical protein
MPLYQIVHQDGEIVSTIASDHIHAVHDIASWLYAKMISPNLTNTRRIHPDDRVVCKERDEDFRVGDVIEAPFDAFMIKEKE